MAGREAPVSGSGHGARPRKGALASLSGNQPWADSAGGAVRTRREFSMKYVKRNHNACRKIHLLCPLPEIKTPSYNLLFLSKRYSFHSSY